MTHLAFRYGPRSVEHHGLHKSSCAVQTPVKTITESTVEDESLGFPSDNEVLFQSRINVMSRMRRRACAFRPMPSALRGRHHAR